MYDPATNTWATKKPMPIPSPVYLCVGAVNNKIYVLGGSCKEGTLLHVYDPATDTWSAKAPKPGRLMQMNCGIVLNNKFYVMGGGVNNPPVPYYPTIVYDPAGNTWSTIADVPNPHYAGATTMLNGKIHFFANDVVNPEDHKGYTPHYIYSSDKNAWTEGKPLSFGLADFGTVNVENSIYIIGGFMIDSSGDVSGLNEAYTEPAGNIKRR